MREGKECRGGGYGGHRTGRKGSHGLWCGGFQHCFSRPRSSSRLILYSWMTILNYSRVCAVEIHGSRLPYSMAPASVPGLRCPWCSQVDSTRFMGYTCLTQACAEFLAFPTLSFFWVCMVFPDTRALDHPPWSLGCSSGFTGCWCILPAVCFFCSESHVRRLKSPEGSTHHYLYTP